MKINREGLELIKGYEGFRANAYKDSAGVWTIGYGTTGMANVGIQPHPGMTVTEAQAEFYLNEAIEKFGKKIKPSITEPMNENEWAAFLSLAYNIGPSAFRRSSVLRHFNAGDKKKAADSFLLWNKAGGKVLRGLQRRRNAERMLFLKPAPIANNPKDGFLTTLFNALLALFRGKK